MRFVVIAIRDFPDLTEWRGSYFVHAADTIEEARTHAQVEIGQRGGKYGCVIFDTSVKDSDPCESISRNDWHLYKNKK